MVLDPICNPNARRGLQPPGVRCIAKKHCNNNETTFCVKFTLKQSVFPPPPCGLQGPPRKPGFPRVRPPLSRPGTRPASGRCSRAAPHLKHIRKLENVSGSTRWRLTARRLQTNDLFKGRDVSVRTFQFLHFLKENCYKLSFTSF